MLLLVITVPVFLVCFVLCLVSFDVAPRSHVAGAGAIASLALGMLVLGVLRSLPRLP